MSATFSRKRIIKAGLWITGGILVVFTGLFIALWLISPGKPEPINAMNGNVREGSISVIEKIALGGEEQYIIIRGADTTKPVMLFLHGGPGNPEIAFMRHFNPGIEDDFIMVYWEQRGAGKSYTKDTPVESMNIARFIADTRELSVYLSKRFNREKIFIMGHSWGSLLAILTVNEHPELYNAFFGIGQAAYQYKGEQISLNWVKEQAKVHNDTKAEEVLAGIHFPDSAAGGEEWIDYLMKERRYVNKYGGGVTHDNRGMWPIIKLVLETREYTMSDKMNFMRSSTFSLQHMWNEVIDANLFNKIDSLQVPTYIFHGRHDNTTPYSVSHDFYTQLKAPDKGFYTFENSAHSPLFEEPDRFNSIVREITGKY